MVDADVLRRLSALNLTTEAFKEVLAIIAIIQTDDDFRRTKNRERMRTVRAQCEHNDEQVYISTKESKIKDISMRGSRLDKSWRLLDADRQWARQEGLKAAEVDLEALRFRDYWVARAGAQGVKRDWSATWRNWIRNFLERTGKSVQPELVTLVSGVWIRLDTPEWHAWRDFRGGNSLPLDSKGGWTVATRWPEGREQEKKVNGSAGVVR